MAGPFESVQCNSFRDDYGYGCSRLAPPSADLFRRCLRNGCREICVHISSLELRDKGRRDGHVGVTPIATWLAAVRNMKAPKEQGFERDDQIISVDVERELALLKLKLQIPPRYFTDMLSCLKVNGTWKIVQKVMTSKM